jgi:hypothetical protein
VSLFLLHAFLGEAADTNTPGKQPDEPGGCWDVEGKMGYFPHVHGNGLKIGKEEVDQVGVWKRAEKGWRAAEWPFGDEDRPKEVV